MLPKTFPYRFLMQLVMAWRDQFGRLELAADTQLLAPQVDKGDLEIGQDSTT
ncbi:MAG: hypothetical protein JO218_15750 [Burkholderiales bacterium]|nr:hypothetical protein [Burkholderiales bacterium]